MLKRTFLGRLLIAALGGVGYGAAAQATPLYSVIVENGRYISELDIQSPPGWQMYRHPIDGVLMTSQLPGCGMQVTHLDYTPVRQQTQQTVFRQELGAQMARPGAVLRSQPQAFFSTNGAGTTLYYASFNVTFDGKSEVWAYFLAEGNLGGRARGFYTCADRAYLQQAIAIMQSVTISLNPVPGAPLIGEGSTGGDPMANAQNALRNQQGISSMQQSLFNSHQTMMDSMRRGW